MNQRRVKIYTEYRKDRGRTRYIVAWSPVPGIRRRASFSSETKAIQEANKIKAAMQRGRETLPPAVLKEFAAASMLRDQMAPTMSILEIVKDYFTNIGTIVKSSTIPIEEAGGEFIASRSDNQNFSERHSETVRHHINRFVDRFETRPLSSISQDAISDHLKKVGGCGKTRLQHLITIRSFFRWARDRKQWLPYGKPTAADLVDPPKVSRSEHEVYSPEEFMRLLVFAPTDLIPFLVLGQFAGIRSEERLRLKWSHWRAEEDNKLVLTEDVTKTNRRRRVDVPPNLAEWLSPLRGRPEEPMVKSSDPFRQAKKIFQAACVRSKKNALRAGYASYHLELYDNAALTAKNDGHSVAELEATYKSISGVTKKKAQEMFDITPHTVVEFAQRNFLPQPEWAMLHFNPSKLGSGLL